jgi:hypothetical protein
VLLPELSPFSLLNTNHAYACLLSVSLVRMSASPEVAGATAILSSGKAEHSNVFRLQLFHLHTIFVTKKDRICLFVMDTISQNKITCEVSKEI